MSEFLFVYVTCANEEEAQRISSFAVGRKLAACANIFAPHTAVFAWDGEIQRVEEVGMILKTTKDRMAALEEGISSLHSYDTPCIVALPVSSGFQPFLDWVENSVK